MLLDVLEAVISGGGYTTPEYRSPLLISFEVSPQKEIKMAKKKGPLLIIKISEKFNILVPEKLETILENELRRGEVSLSIDINVESTSFSQYIYQDDLKRGVFTIENRGDGYWNVCVEGEVVKDLDPSFAKKLIEALDGGKTLPVLMSSIGFSDPEDVYSCFVDGDEQKTITIGLAQLK